jgi:hypothetical protein
MREGAFSCECVVGVSLCGPPRAQGVIWVSADRPAIAQLVEHLTVECCSNQMVPGSIPGGRILECVCALLRAVRASHGCGAKAQRLCDVVVVLTFAAWA